MRIRGYDEETEELSEDLKTITGDIADLTKTADNAQGVSLFTDETKKTYKSTYQILKEISGIWSDLTDKQQAGLLEKLGGKRGGQVLAGLLADFSEVDKAMTNMSNAAGSADREMSIIEESIDYKLNNLKQTWVGLVQELISRGTLGNIVDALTKLSEVIAHIVTHGGELVAVLSAIGSIQVFKHKKEVTEFLTKLLEGLNGMLAVAPAVEGAELAKAAATEADAKATEEAVIAEGAKAIATKADSEATEDAAEAELEKAVATEADAKATEEAAAAEGAKAAATKAGEKATKDAAGSAAGLSKAWAGLAETLGVSGGALAGIVAGITAVVGAIAFLVYKTHQAGIEIRKFAKELGSGFKDKKDDIESYRGEIEKLQKTIKDSSTSYEEAKSARERLLAIQDELIQKYGKEEGSIRLITDAINGQVSALDTLTKKEWSRTQAEFENTNLKGFETLKMAQMGVGNKSDLMLAEMENRTISIEFSPSDKELVERLATLYGGKAKIIDVETGQGVLELSGNLEEIQEQILSIQETAKSLDMTNTFQSDLLKNYGENQKIIDQYKDYYDSYIFYERILKSGLEKDYLDFTKVISDYKAAAIDGNEEATAEALNSVKATYSLLGEHLDNLNLGDAERQSIENWFDSLAPEITVELNKDDLIRQLKESGSELSEAFSKFDSLDQLTNFENIENPSEELKQAYEVIETFAENAGFKIEEVYNALRKLDSFNTKLLVSESNLDIARDYQSQFSNTAEGAERFGEVLQGLTDEEQLLIGAMKDSGEFTELFGEVLKDNELPLDTSLIKTNQLQSSLKELIKRYKELHPELSQSSDDLNAWSDYLAKALEKIGMSEDDFQKYVETLKQMNPELANNQEEAEKCALANQLFSNAVNDLQSNWDTYKENLSDATKKTPEFNETIEKMADNLEYLTGIDFSVTDAQEFLSDEKNLKDLEDAINGDDEALQRLQASAAEGIYIEVDETEIARIASELERLVSSTGIEIPAGIDTENFNAELNNLINWMNGTELGELSATAIIDENPFMAALADIIAQGGNAANQLISMFSDLGWDVSWDYTKTNLQLPRVTTQNQVMKGQSGYQYAKSQYDKKGNGWAASAPQFTGYKVTGYDNVPITSPDNIRFVRKGKGGGGTRRPTPQKPYVPTSIKAPSNTNKPGGGGGGGGGGKNASDNSANEQEDTYDELFDYFERRLTVLNDSAELLDKNLENVVGSMAKNTLLDAKGGILREEMNNYEDALNMYQQKADEAFNKLPADIQARIKDGAVALTEFIGQGNEEVVEAMNDYQNWADKVSDVKQNLAELKETLRQLELQKFNNIVEDFTNQFDIRQNNGIDLIKEQISLLEEAGQVIGEGFYTTQIDQTQKQLDTLTKEKEALVNQMQSAIKNGVEVGTDEWQEMINKLAEVDSSILQCKTSIEELDNAILQLHVDMFDRVQNTFSNFHDELEDLRSLIDSQDLDVATKDNNWTSEGLGQLGLLAQQYEMASYQVQQYEDEIGLLNQQYVQGRYSTTEYADRLADLMSKQRDAAAQTESIKDSIMDLNKTRVDIVVKGIEEEIDAYKKLTDAQIEALDAEKDLHDYQQSIAESNKSITDLEKQLAAMAGDDSAAAVAKRKKLEEQLSEARQALQEKEYDRSISDQREALNKQYEDYKDARDREIEELQATLEERNLIISQSFEDVRLNADQIGIVIKDIALAHGIETTDALTSAWNAGSEAIAAYGEVLNASSSQFLMNISSVESGVYQLQNQANATANSLANMYATNADNLVSQLTNSYNAASNMKNMTDALGQSMINCLDRGYAIDSITNMLNSAAAAADNVASSANNAASSLSKMASALSDYNNQTVKSYNLAGQSGYEISRSGKYGTQAGYDSIINGVNLKDRNTSGKRFAKGIAKVDKDQIAWTNEAGQELIVSPSDGSILTRLDAGDAVFSATQTKNLWAMSKMNPSDFVKGMNISVPAANGGNAFNIHYDSMVTVNGNVNDSLDMMKIATAQAQQNFNSNIKKLSDGIHK